MMYTGCRQSEGTVAKMPWISIVYVLSPLWRTLYVRVGLAGATERTMLEEDVRGAGQVLRQMVSVLELLDVKMQLRDSH